MQATLLKPRVIMYKSIPPVFSRNRFTMVYKERFANGASSFICPPNDPFGLDSLFYPSQKERLRSVTKLL